MKKKITFEKKIMLSAVLISLTPLIISYTIFLISKLADIEENINESLQYTGFSIAESQLVQEKLYNRENDFTIQEYSKKFIEKFPDIDIIVIADMTGEKYSHLDERQIGNIYVNSDKKEVLDSAASYYSVMEGSMGTTFRWFEPVYYNGEQVGFVMVGKYYKEITIINSKIKSLYVMLFVFAVMFAIIASKIFADKIRKSILNMDPDEIAVLYNQKKIIINSVKDGIIAINKNKEVVEINNSCYELFDDFNVDEIMDKIRIYIQHNKDIEMREFIINNKKVFVSIKNMHQNNNYLGAVITMVDRQGINKIAKEITGIDEVIKNLRATIHEFKNNLHVIYGLIQLQEYEEAAKYILTIQHIQNSNVGKFKAVEDSYVNALLLSRELVAKERKIKFTLLEESFLFFEHGIIDSYDVVTILGNLIENAFEACSHLNKDNKYVEISLYEDEEQLEIQVKDNGIQIGQELKDRIYEEGVSTKGENRGTGLYLVKNRVDLYNGEIEIEEFDDEKIFVITLYKGEK